MALRRTATYRLTALLIALVALTHSAAAAPQEANDASPAQAPVLVAPKLLSDSSTPYPDGAQGEASVVLTLLIDRDGSVQSAIPTEINEPFSSAAAAAALHWKFDPATRNGSAIPSRIRYAVVFHPVVADESAKEQEPTEGQSETRSSSSPPATAPKSPPREIIIIGDRVEPSRTATLSRAEVREIPGTFGDPFRAIEIMPGVTPIVSGLPFFYVRGAPPGDVGYFLDGVRVPLLFHVGVGPSVVHPGLMDRVDLYPGGYPARFGRYSGGIVAGETLQPQKELRGEYNLRFVDAGALVETPFDGGRGTALVGGRYSYTAALLTLLQANTQLDYWDYQARATYDLTPDDRVGVFAFGSYDYLGQKTPTQTTTVFGTEFHRIDARFDHRIGERGLLRIAATVGLDRTRLPHDRFVRNRLGGIRSELTYHLAPDLLLRAGTDVELDAYDVQLQQADAGPSSNRVASLFPTRSDASLGGRADLVISLAPGFEITPGARVDLYASQGAAALGLDPRLSTRLAVNDRMRVLSSFGIAHQAPAFAVPVPGFQPGGLRGGLQEALQESAGIEYDLGQGTTATASVYHNAFLNLSDALSATPRVIDGCPPGGFPIDSIAGDRGAQPTGNGGGCGQPRFAPGTIGPDRSGGGGQAADSRGASNAASALEARATGSAYGLELFVKRKLTSRMGGFLSYTLSRSVRSVDRTSFVANFDRTHVLNAAIAYNLGRNWRAGTRGTLYTGLPKAFDPSNPSSTRLPPFFRLDVRFEKRWELGEKKWISFVAEWLNATLSKEAVATTCTLQGCQTQLIGPVTIPTIGVEGGF